MDTRLLTGIVETLILEILSHGPSYGYEICQKTQQKSRGLFEFKEGSLYPALHRLERQKLLASHWEQAENRRRKYYKLTAAGRQALVSRRREWEQFSMGVNKILGAAHGLA